MNHDKRPVTIGGADHSRIKDDPTPLPRRRHNRRRELAEQGEVA